MKKFAAAAVLPLFATLLCAQTESQTTTTTKTTTFAGTLVDAGCRNTQTERKETSTTRPDENTTRTQTTTTNSNSTECPVSMTTTSFGLLTPEGQYVRFDDPSNTKIVEVVKSNKSWDKMINEHKPVKVRVIGTRNGDVVVVEKIQ